LKEFNIGEYIPINRNKFKEDIIKSKDINYFLGLLVADGSYAGNRKRDKYRIDLTIGLLDIENIEFIKEFYYNNNIKYGIIKKKSNCVQFYNSGKIWRTKLFELGLNYVKGDEKSTPISILNGTYQMKSNFIAGLFDGDGHISKRGQIILVNNSNKLLCEVQGMLLEFGIVSYIKQEKKSFRLVILTTSINSFKKHISFRLKRKEDVLSDYFPTIKTNVDFIPHKEEIFEVVKSDLTQSGFYLKNKGLNPVDFKRFPNHVKYLSYENLNNIIKLYEFNEKSINTQLLEIKNNHYFYDEIVSIKYVGDEQMYDLEIDEIHQYVANGFIVHNSQGSTYTHVFIMENDINDNWVVKERNQIKYVSLTRPTHRATVLTTKIDE
jgi:intein/homing endonuclease